MTKKILSVVISVLFLFNDLSFALSPRIVSGDPNSPTRPDMHAAAHNLFASKSGPGIKELNDEFTSFIGKPKTLPPSIKRFIPVDYNNPPAGWENNPLLKETDLIKALEYFRDKEAQIPADKLEIIEGDFPVDEETGELPIACLEKHGDKYVLVVHTKFVQMWSHIRANDVWFVADVPESGERVLSVAWGIFYWLAKHEMMELEKQGLSRKGDGGHIGYLYPETTGIEPVGKDLRVEYGEYRANDIGGHYRLYNDAIKMWFLASYCLGNSTRYNNDILKARIEYFLYGAEVFRERLFDEFPDLTYAWGRVSHTQHEKLMRTVEIALAINAVFFDRKEGLLRVPQTTVSEKLREEAGKRLETITAPPLYATGEGKDGGKASDSGVRLSKEDVRKVLEATKYDFLTHDIELGDGRFVRTESVDEKLLRCWVFHREKKPFGGDIFEKGYVIYDRATGTRVLTSFGPHTSLFTAYDINDQPIKGLEGIQISVEPTYAVTASHIAVIQKDNRGVRVVVYDRKTGKPVPYLNYDLDSAKPSEDIQGIYGKVRRPLKVVINDDYIAIQTRGEDYSDYDNGIEQRSNPVFVFDLKTGKMVMKETNCVEKWDFILRGHRLYTAARKNPGLILDLYSIKVVDLRSGKYVRGEERAFGYEWERFIRSLNWSLEKVTQPRAEDGTPTSLSESPKEPPVAATARKIRLEHLARHPLVNALIRMIIDYSRSEEGLKDVDRFVDYNHGDTYWFGSRYTTAKSFVDIFNKLAQVYAKRAGRNEVSIDDEIAVAKEMVRIAGLEVDIDRQFVERLKERLALQVEHFGVEEGKIYAMRAYRDAANKILAHARLERAVHLAVIKRAFGGDINAYRLWRKGMIPRISLVGGVKDKYKKISIQISDDTLTYSEFAQRAHDIAEAHSPLSGIIPTKTGLKIKPDTAIPYLVEVPTADFSEGTAGGGILSEDAARKEKKPQHRTHPGKSPEDIRKRIVNMLAGKEYTLEQQFYAVYGILAEDNPALAAQLNKLSHLTEEGSLKEIVKAIKTLKLSKEEEAIIRLAFFTPGEGGGILSEDAAGKEKKPQHRTHPGKSPEDVEEIVNVALKILVEQEQPQVLYDLVHRITDDKIMQQVQDRLSELLKDRRQIARLTNTKLMSPLPGYTEVRRILTDRRRELKPRTKPGKSPQQARFKGGMEIKQFVDTIVLEGNIGRAVADYFDSTEADRQGKLARLTEAYPTATPEQKRNIDLFREKVSYDEELRVLGDTLVEEQPVKDEEEMLSHIELFGALTEDGIPTSRGRESEGEPQAGTGIRATAGEHPLIQVIDEWIINILKNEGPGALGAELTQDEKARIVWPAVKLLHQSEIEILALTDRRNNFKLTGSMENALKRINELGGNIAFRQCDANNIERILKESTKAKRIVITDGSLGSLIATLSENNPGLFRDVRFLNLALPAEYMAGDSQARTVHQARFVMTAVLARLLEKEGREAVEATLRMMLKGHFSEGDLDAFINNLKTEENDSTTPAEIAKRIKFFLGKIIKWTEIIGREIHFMKEFWYYA